MRKSREKRDPGRQCYQEVEQAQDIPQDDQGMGGGFFLVEQIHHPHGQQPDGDITVACRKRELSWEQFHIQQGDEEHPDDANRLKTNQLGERNGGDSLPKEGREEQWHQAQEHPPSEEARHRRYAQDRPGRRKEPQPEVDH